ncbi:MAG: hypothetical protein ACK46X_06325 [Candidatus Sericytochromatia bacterium]
MNIGGAVSAAAAAAKQAAIEAARKAAQAAAQKAAAEAAAKLAAQAAQTLGGLKPAGGTADAAEAKPQDLAKAALAIANQADPLAAIEQAAGKHTCAAANKQEAMREHDPKVYNQMVKDLKENGAATMPNGQKLYLSQTNADYIDRQDLPESDKDNMRVQAALMDYANQTEEYDMEKDLSIGDDGATHQGLTEDQMARLDQLDNTTTTADAGQTEAIAAVAVALDMLNPFNGVNGDHAEVLSDHVQAAVKDAAREGQNLTMALDTGDGDKHAYTIVGVSDGGDTVTVRDTAGEQTLTKEEFDEAVTVAEGDVGEDGSGGRTSGRAGGRY